jgi:hypothetical protein
LFQKTGGGKIYKVEPRNNQDQYADNNKCIYPEITTVIEHFTVKVRMQVYPGYGLKNKIDYNSLHWYNGQYMILSRRELYP